MQIVSHVEFASRFKWIEPSRGVAVLTARGNRQFFDEYKNRAVPQGRNGEQLPRPINRRPAIDRYGRVIL